MELLLSEATLRVGIEIADDLVPVCLVPLELFAEISQEVVNSQLQRVYIYFSHSWSSTGRIKLTDMKVVLFF